MVYETDYMTEELAVGVAPAVLLAEIDPPQISFSLVAIEIKHDIRIRDAPVDGPVSRFAESPVCVARIQAANAGEQHGCGLSFVFFLCPGFVHIPGQGPHLQRRDGTCKQLTFTIQDAPAGNRDFHPLVLVVSNLLDTVWLVDDLYDEKARFQGDEEHEHCSKGRNREYPGPLEHDSSFIRKLFLIVLLF